jgi:hypothetical protein
MIILLSKQGKSGRLARVVPGFHRIVHLIQRLDRKCCLIPEREGCSRGLFWRSGLMFRDSINNSVLMLPMGLQRREDGLPPKT